MSSTSIIFHAGAGVVCLAWTVLVLSTGRGLAAWLLAAACGSSSLWAAAVALEAVGLPALVAVLLEAARWVVWLAVLLFFFRRVAGNSARPLTVGVGLCAATAGGAVFLGSLAPDLIPLAGLGRFILALLVVILAENLFRASDEAERWHFGLPAIALGGLSAYDLLLLADMGLSRGSASAVLVDARAAIAAIVTPLLAVAAMRDRRWRRDPPVSRQVVFQGATLVVAGAFLLTIGVLGEALRRLDVEWAAAAQASLIGGAVISLLVAVSSRSARSHLRRLFVDPFFTARYDYRREWLRCVNALSAGDARSPAEYRAVRAIADAVDSPAGVLLVREPGRPGMRWAGSWNRASIYLEVPAGDAIVAALDANPEVLVLDNAAASSAALSGAYGPLWMAVPLMHGREGLSGVVLLAPPRAPFELDAEVQELLRTLGCEVAMFLAERRAAEGLADGRQLQDYAKRFAFVAHDVKTVSSQLSLLLANAEENIDDPEFQQDMLLTVRTAATRINALIQRLGQPGDVPSEETAIAPAERLRWIAAAQHLPVHVEETGPAVLAAVPPTSFDTALGHLINNAVEASPPGEDVRVLVGREGAQVVVEVVDRGPGMTPEFIRDELFRPLSTSKRGGSGIGAWQALDLLRKAGCELLVLSSPGAGTTMRVLLPFREGGTGALAEAA
ncbi:XrtA/PEP-CTERM system histidine kinase PrsK [Roseomonas sp. WA12]